ncbi:oxidoreductase [Lapillicoccus jejuensis]|uniref:Nucleoside-diphosphate-sugar epimerase n=1 Tax=Lapillicoccus jejuensis TaxID=402171 RepID=A0A542E4R5_9MICO|nr:oxidoreductase [Lapillicoccus jejuensis]TQJ10315.1 nucleoside-diphosphate-sugar epimerase [Lapillicoccus jejuensis]
MSARVLVLGGTAWLGGAVARHALAAGHAVDCLARGVSGRVPEGARLVVGDRSTEGAYDALGAGTDPAGDRYDLVVDVSRQPGEVRGALDALADRAARWVFVSSGSVYADHSVLGGGLGGTPLPLLPPLEGDTGGPEQYGEAKVACEDAVRARRGDDALVARSGLIAGYGDPSDRFGYWVGRCALAGQDGRPLLVPASLGQGAQVLDVLDLAAWLVDAGLAGTTGTVDAYGPRRTLGEVVDVAAAVAGFDGERVVVDDDALRGAGVDEFMGPRSLALWLADPAWLGFAAHEDVSARRAGLVARPLEGTTTAALAWEREQGLHRTGRRAGLDRADELALVERLAPR